VLGSGMGMDGWVGECVHVFCCVFWGLGFGLGRRVMGVTESGGGDGECGEGSNWFLNLPGLDFSMPMEMWFCDVDVEGVVSCVLAS
jgi:hypothetical protein